MTSTLRQYFSREREPINRVFLGIVMVILLFGTLAFFSASFGLLTRGGPSFASVVFGQLTLGLIPGLILAYIFSRIHYTLWRRLALILFFLAIGMNLLLFVPQLSFSHGGATRWLEIGSLTIQPSEFLKIAFLIYLASWLAGGKERLKEVWYGILPFAIILGATLAFLVIQRDTDTSVVMTATAIAMYFVAGGNVKDMLIILAVALIGLGVLFFSRPYLMERLKVFFNPSRDPEKSGYQVTQSLVAIGAGEWIGRGFGQSIQKYSKLPEPIGDSIYAVIGEEFGFAGSVFVILIFYIFAVQGIRIAIRSPDSFGRLLTMGIVIMITTQSFVNIGSMLGLLPISGLPLTFISHGGTSLLASLASLGMVFNVSRHAQ